MEKKICPLCGNEFISKQNRIVCDKPHYKTCKYCNEVFQLHNSGGISKNLNRDCCYKKECIAKSRKEKRDKTNLEKYGDTNYNNPNKAKETYLEKYGDYKSHTEKIKKTMLERYGVDNPAKSKEIYDKIRKTNLERYGVETPFESKEIQDKFKKTMNEKYGTNWAMESEELKNKMMKTKMEKYGNLGYTSDLKIAQEKAINTNMKKYGVPWFCMTDKCVNAQGNIISNINKEFSDLLFSNGIENSLEFRIGKFSYDIKVNNTLIEIDPTYSHNSSISPTYKRAVIKPKEKGYHYNKMMTAKENGYSCIHIFDWDNWDKIINLIKIKEKLYARKLKLKEITKQEANEFLDKYHLQNSCRGNIINLCLYYNDEPIQVMTFGKPRYNKNYEYELLRLCSSPKYLIIGGSEKLFKYFINNYNPKSIISYCDNSKFSGNVYSKLKFTLESSGKPNKHWYNVKTKQHITNNLLLQRGFDQLFNTNYGKGTSNEELMLQHGFVEVYDCGQSVWAYRT